jgi:hypothetical protein
MTVSGRVADDVEELGQILNESTLIHYNALNLISVDRANTVIPLRQEISSKMPSLALPRHAFLLYSLLNLSAH